ncbi:MAG: peptide ABC transporter substrate-binding protein [Chloroflexi bacterium]|nr:peptide ABC transporter substrate-binding protein [Chloroflexota bacterium]
MSLQLSRRRLLGRLSVGLVAGSLTTLIAACSQTTAPTSPAAPVTAGAATAVTAPTTASAATGVSTASTPRGGNLSILMWQGPTITNAHLAQGAKDWAAARFCCEPLLTVSTDGVFSPILAAEVPSVANGGLAADGKTVTYKLKPNVKWADGQPFTADDVVFTYQYVSDKDTAAVTAGSYSSLDSVEAVDPLTVRLTFKQPTGGWYVPFLGYNGTILPKHTLENSIGAAARDAPYNLKAFGTGPYLVQDFSPGDHLALTANPNYRDSGKPFFDQITIKGGGDPTSAGRAVFQTGEYDYAWNLQVEAQVLNELLRGGKGDLVTSPGGGVEQVFFNMADPNVEVDGEHGSPNSQHPFLADQRVRQALALAIDRATIATQLYGQTGDATSNILTIPTNLISSNTSLEFDLDQANRILDAAGYARGGDGIRVTPGGTRMHVVFQTSTNSLRQKEQDIIKDGWQKIGVETELKSVDASVFFASDAGNPDTYGHFSTDVEMLTFAPDSPFPVLYMKRFYARDPSTDWAQKSNAWSAANFLKWKDDQYNALFDAAAVETDPDKAAADWKALNDLVVNAYADVPLVDRKAADGKARGIQGPNAGPFDPFSWNVADWTRS